MKENEMERQEDIRDGFYLEAFQSVKSNDSAWYQNIQFIGKGGNGVTFYVLCTGGKYRGQHFALKVLYRISSEERRNRFRQEVDFLKKQNQGDRYLLNNQKNSAKLFAKKG